MASWGQRLTRISAEIADVKRVVVVVVDCLSNCFLLTVLAKILLNSILKTLLKILFKSILKILKLIVFQKYFGQNCQQDILQNKIVF